MKTKDLKKVKEIRISCHDFNLYTTKEPQLINETDGNENCYGFLKFGERMIVVKEGMDKHFYNEVLLHECIHAIDQTFLLGMNELQVNTLGLELYNMLRNNKKLFK